MLRSIANLARAQAFNCFKRSIYMTHKLNEAFDFNINKFNDIHIKSDHVNKFYKENKLDSKVFEITLRNSLENWLSENRSAVWIYLPIDLSHLAAIAARHGFKYHHAENNEAVLCKWLNQDCESKIPMFATHQVGVAGIVYREDTQQLLMIQDRNMVRQLWKFPGGAANLGENIEQTAVREVYEETGVKSKFASVIGFRQQHNYPGGHGRSDLYIVCRLEPLSYEINACSDEIKACEWIDLEKMCNYSESSLTQLMAKSIKHGSRLGFEHVDIKPKEMASVFPGRTFRYFFRNLNEN